MEWFAVLLSEFAGRKDLWDKWGLAIIDADARALEQCLGSSSKAGLKHSALVGTRRAFRKLFRSEALGQNAVKTIVSSLTTKGSSATAKNAVLLGVVAGVSARLPSARPSFEAVKKECYAFYIREIIGSRVTLPPHISNSLHDLFQGFTDMHDLRNELIPAIEKALLRAPEVVLNDLVTPMVTSLNQDIDLSEALQKSLLKPLLNNVKSTNASIRIGALRTFAACAQKSTDESVTDKIADEILNPLRQNKVTAPEQRVLHAQLLSALVPSTTLAKKIPAALASIALKEPNEAVIEAEIGAVGEHSTYSLASSAALDPSVVDAFAKGIADKKPSVRRIWAVQACSIFWKLRRESLTSPGTIAFAQPTLAKMCDIFIEANDNPLPAAQNGLVTAACSFAAVALLKFRNTEDAKLRSTLEKATIAKTLLFAGNRQHSLLSFKVYSKLQHTEDLIWAVRALSALAQDLTMMERSRDIEEAWSQAFLYFITASSVPAQVRKQAAKVLAETYYRYPRQVGQIVVNGVWKWRRDVDTNTKDTAAVSARSGNAHLYLALKAICPKPNEVQDLGYPWDSSVVKEQLIHMLILSRPILIPHASWIDLCLQAGVDPGTLVDGNSSRCLQEVQRATEVGNMLSFS